VKHQRRAAPNVRANKTRLGIEALEGRALMSATALLDGNILKVFGDAADNNLLVNQNAAGQLRVFDSGVSVAVQGGTPTTANVQQIQLFGNDGNDTITVATNVSINALFDGGNGNDLLVSGGGVDSLSGGAGDDTIRWDPGTNRDVVDGGDGNDTLIVNGNSVGDAPGINDNFVVRRSTTDPSRVVVERTNLVPFTIDTGTTENFTVNGGDGNDSIVVNDLTGTPTQKLTLLGGNGNDSIDANIFRNGNIANPLRFMGLIDGGAGNDMLRSGPGVDTILGGSGDDTIFWDPGTATDLIEGGSGNDTVVTILDGDGFRPNGNSDDRFDVRANGSRLLFQRFGDNGAIPFTLDIGTTENLVVNGDDGNDIGTVQDLTGVANLRSVVLTGDNGNDMLDASNLNAGIDLVITGGAGNDMLMGGAGADYLDGGSGNDTISGNRGADFILGGSGSDMLMGGAGSDLILGGSGRDTIDGGAGNDILDGGLDGQQDVITTGPGRDVVVNYFSVTSRGRLVFEDQVTDLSFNDVLLGVYVG
jgi:Ca2+-binding RTX toxin-like protein